MSRDDKEYTTVINTCPPTKVSHGLNLTHSPHAATQNMSWLDYRTYIDNQLATIRTLCFARSSGSKFLTDHTLQSTELGKHPSVFLLMAQMRSVTHTRENEELNDWASAVQA